MDADGLIAAYGALGPGDVAALDRAAAAAGVDVLQLMEVAGLQVARAAWRQIGSRRARLLIIAGRGNNGGDGLVAARLLDSWGCTVSCRVIAPGENRVGATAARQLQILSGLDIEATVDDDPEAVAGAARTADLVVDALLGTGLQDAPRAPDAAVIEALSGATPVLSIDVPSGLDAGSGTAPGACVAAAVTVTLTAMKRGLWSAEGRGRAGELWVADIGMPAAAWRRAGLTPPSAVNGGRLLCVPVG